MRATQGLAADKTSVIKIQLLVHRAVHTMIIAHIEGATRVLGPPVGSPEVKPLAIRDVVYTDGTRGVMSAWTPTPEEVNAILNGEPIYLCIFGTNMPPAFVGVKGVSA